MSKVKRKQEISLLGEDGIFLMNEFLKINNLKEELQSNINMLK